ncbi:MAG: hypothetical protein E7641_03860 [Ruminococcaceae bacterium]|nr:hypothetical protein [Oscillospiraceae bacterium]
MKDVKKLDIVVPAELDWDWHTPDEIVAELTEQHENYGIDRFILYFPSKGFECSAPPTPEYVEYYAKNFNEVKRRVEPLGIDLGWWFCLSVGIGHSDSFTGLTSSDGRVSYQNNCPLDPAFEEYIYDFTERFTRIARPSFIFMEDDMTIYRHTRDDGCFCKFHLEEFAKRMGRYYTPEELVSTFATRTPEALALQREWRKLSEYALVVLSENIRRAVDSVDPDIPIGSMQQGCCHEDGDCTYAVAKALAGDRHRPFSRLFGAIYEGVPAEKIPRALFHPIYSRQHITEDFEYFFETDSFPHTRFFTSGKEMQAMLSGVYSAGYDGSTLQTQQCLDYANEDTTYGYSFAKERPRHEAIHKIAKRCELKGVEITFDPFYNTVELHNKHPFWTQSVSFFGIPFTTLESSVAFWDYRPAKYYPHDQVMKYLSKTLFLDSEAAKALCERGYGKYLGAEIGECLLNGPETRDICAREIICDGFAPDSKGRNMAMPYLAFIGPSKPFAVIPTDEKTEIMTEYYNFKREFTANAMTRFKNELGGTIVIMGMTIEKNYSQSLLNYRRQKLFHQIITEACDEFVLVKDQPRIFTFMNEPREATDDFIGALTLLNLSSDNCESLTLRLPEKWKAYKEILSMDDDGNWTPASFEVTEDGIKLNETAEFMRATYLLFK